MDKKHYFYEKGRGLHGPRREKTFFGGFLNNKGTDKPVHLSNLISAFVIGFWKIVISYLATSKISVSVAEKAALSLALSETPKTGFFASRPTYTTTSSLDT